MELGDEEEPAPAALKGLPEMPSMDPLIHHPLSPSSSSEFEFRPPPNPNLPSADELFSHGFLLPFQHRPLLQPQAEAGEEQEGEEEEEEGEDGDEKPNNIIATHQQQQQQQQQQEETSTDLPQTNSATPSKRWKDLFRLLDHNHHHHPHPHYPATDKNNTPIEETSKKKQHHRRTNNKSGNCTSSSSSSSTAAELNFNLWPFSRSRSAGNNLWPRPIPALQRKVRSAPCSRSNSRSRWAAAGGSPIGIPVGRSSPVWRRAPKRPLPPTPPPPPAVKSTANKGGIPSINLKVNACVGYGGLPVGDDKDALPAGEPTSSASSRLAGWRALFSSKKVY